MPIIEDIVSAYFNKQLLIFIIPMGYLIFLFYFSGSKKWKEDFSDFDKISFSVLTAFVILYFIAFPIALNYTLIHNFFIFTGEQNIINLPQEQLQQVNISIFVIIGSIFFLLRLFFHSALFEKQKIFDGICLAIFFIMLFLITSFFFFLISFYFSGFFNYIEYFYNSTVFSIIMLAVFILIYSSIHENFKNLSDRIDNYGRNISNCKYLKYNYIAIIVIIFILSSSLIGISLFKPTIKENGEHIEEIEIDYLPVTQYSGNVNAEMLIEKEYKVKTKLIPWVKIDTNLTLKRAFGEVNWNYSEYDIDGSNFIAVDCIKQTNITVRGTKEFYISDELTYTINDPAFENDTEVINLTLKNNVPTIIKIKDIEIIINENYNLTKDDFNKIRDFENRKGSIRGYEKEKTKLLLTDVYLYKESSSTISLFLTKIDEK